MTPLTYIEGRGSSVGMTNGYEMNGRGMESVWEQCFRARPYWPCGPPSLQYEGYRFLPRG